MSKRKVIKVADFGLSFLVSGNLRIKEGKVPTRWLAPEVLHSNLYSTKSDTWALGVTLYEIWTDGSQPYEGKNLQEVRAFVCTNNTLTPPECKSCQFFSSNSIHFSAMPQSYQDLMALCFEFDVTQRLTPVQIRERASKDSR